MRSTARNSWFALKTGPSLSHSAYRKGLFSAALLILSITSCKILAVPSVNHAIDLERPSQLSSSHVWQNNIDTRPKPQKHERAQLSLIEIFNTFHSTINTLQKVKWSDTDIQSQLIKIDAVLNELEKVSKGWSRNGVSETYAGALALDAELLSTVKKGESEATLKVISEVGAGLEIKLRFAKASKGPSPALVELVVSTFRGNVEVSDYEVWYVPRGWADVVDKYRRFDDLSSPSIKDLSPGNYLIWLQRDGTSVTDRTPVTLGDDGKSKRRVQLPVSR